MKFKVVKAWFRLKYCTLLATAAYYLLYMPYPLKLIMTSAIISIGDVTKVTQACLEKLNTWKRNLCRTTKAVAKIKYLYTKAGSAYGMKPGRESQDTNTAC